MLIEIEINENENIDEYEYRTFMSRGKAYPISHTRYFPEDGSESFEVEITGWQDGKPVQAFMQCIEDSGDGEAWLIYGGNHGIRMRKVIDSLQKKEFSLEHSDEWNEKYLCYHRRLYPIAIQPYQQ